MRKIDIIVANLKAAIRDEFEGFLDVGTLPGEIRSGRERMGLSLQKLADRTDLSKAYLWDVEQGRSTNPSIKTIMALAHALELPWQTLAQAAINTLKEEPPHDH